MTYDNTDTNADGAIDAPIDNDSVSTDQEAVVEPVVRAYSAPETYRDYLVADYADPFDAANTALDNGAEKVELPSGTHEIETTLEVTGRQSVVGPGPGSTYDPIVDLDPLIDLSSEPYQNGPSVEGLRIQDSGGVLTGETITATDDTRWPIVKNCWILSETATAGVTFGGAGGWVAGVIRENVILGPSVGVELSGTDQGMANSTSVIGNWIDQYPGDGAKPVTGIAVNWGNNHRVLRNMLQNVSGEFIHFGADTTGSSITAFNRMEDSTDAGVRFDQNTSTPHFLLMNQISRVTGVDIDWNGTGDDHYRFGESELRAPPLASTLDANGEVIQDINILTMNDIGRITSTSDVFKLEQFFDGDFNESVRMSQDRTRIGQGDVIAASFPTFTAPPTNPVKGDAVIQDGVNWDPAGTGDERLVVYLNGSWVSQP